MDLVYDFVEGIHVFIPIVAVVSLILIVYFCGIGRPHQPSDDYITKLQQAEKQTKKKQQAKPSKGVPPSHKNNSTTARQRRDGVESGGVGQRRTTSDSVEEADAPPEEGVWVTVTPKRSRGIKQTTPTVGGREEPEGQETEEDINEKSDEKAPISESKEAEESPVPETAPKEETPEPPPPKVIPGLSQPTEPQTSSRKAKRKKQQAPTAHPPPPPTLLPVEAPSRPQTLPAKPPVQEEDGWVTKQSKKRNRNRGGGQTPEDLSSGDFEETSPASTDIPSSEVEIVSMGEETPGLESGSNSSWELKDHDPPISPEIIECSELDEDVAQAAHLTEEEDNDVVVVRQKEDKPPQEPDEPEEVKEEGSKNEADSPEEDPDPDEGFSQPRRRRPRRVL